jgi:hypothetical protein
MWTRAQQHRLNVVTLLVILTGLGACASSSLILASGILPIPEGALAAGGAAIGATTAIAAGAFGRTRTRFWTGVVLALAMTIWGASALFLHFQRGGLEHAKRYGARWAAILERQHATTGRWPATFAAAAAVSAAPPLDLPRPYLASCTSAGCDKVAGYVLVYQPAAPQPLLRIARRDVRLEWDWSARRWRHAGNR